MYLPFSFRFSIIFAILFVLQFSLTQGYIKSNLNYLISIYRTSGEKEEDFSLKNSMRTGTKRGRFLQEENNDGETSRDGIVKQENVTLFC